MTPPPHRERDAFLLERWRERGIACDESRHETGEHCGHRAQDERGAEDGDVNPKALEDGVRNLAAAADDRSQDPREAYACRARDQRQHEALDQELTDQTRARGPERAPECELLAAIDAARKQKVRGIGGGDQKNQHRNGHEEREHLADFFPLARKETPHNRRNVQRGSPAGCR